MYKMHAITPSAPFSAEMKKLLNEKHEQLKANRAQVSESLQNVSENALICKMSTNELRDGLRTKEITPLRVLQAFQRKCRDIESTNFLGSFITDSADFASSIEDLDASLLAGIPVSIKDMIRVKGQDATIGIVKNCMKPAEKDSVIVEVLKHQKAVPFITTSMALTSTTQNCSNVVYGKQVNPRFEEYVAGGSSGGEGIGVSLDASPIGIGSDLAGSIRFPAAFNEICGLKTTKYRLSTKSNDGEPRMECLKLPLVYGPMGRKVDDLRNFMETVLCQKHFELDPLVVPLLFNQAMYDGTDKTKLRIGYYDTFEDPHLVSTIPCVRRGITAAKQALEDQGHEVVPFQVPRPCDIIFMAFKCLCHDGGKRFLEMLEDEPLSPSIKNTLRYLKLPHSLQLLSLPYVTKKYGKVTEMSITSTGGLKTADEVRQLLQDIDAYCEEFMEGMRDVDAIICPIYPVPLPRKDMPSCYGNATICYSVLYNLLNLPAGVVPVGRVTDEDLTEWNKFMETDHGHSIFTQNPIEVGMPLSVQVVAKPFQEERVLRIMKSVEERINFTKSMPANM